jgi:hypothetical protein
MKLTKLRIVWLQLSSRRSSYGCHSGLIVLLRCRVRPPSPRAAMQMIAGGRRRANHRADHHDAERIFDLKRAALAGIYSAAWRRLALANDRRASIGRYLPSRSNCQNVQPLQAGRPCTSAPIL